VEHQGKPVRFRPIFLFAWVLLIASAAMASEEQRTKIRIAIDGDDGEHQVFRFDSDDTGFDLDDLAVGESRTIEDESGNAAVVSRTEEGFELEVDGEKVPLDGIGHHHAAMMANHHECPMHDSKRMHVVRTEAGDGVTVITGPELDEGTRERIRDALRDAGREGEVIFLDGSELHADDGMRGHREVRIIKKEIDKTN